MMLINYLPYIICIAIICVGLYGAAASGNYIKKLVSLGILQSGVILFFIAMAKVSNGQIPILNCLDMKSCPADNFANPLPHVLMLTAIVVGVATLALGVALVIRIQEEYDSIEEDELIAIEARDL